mgnify:CR=1 FL=1
MPAAKEGAATVKSYAFPVKPPELVPGVVPAGVAAPVILIALRLLQGLALGGEYGGAATYVAEHG